MLNSKGKVVFQKWVDPTQAKDYCHLCQLIHRNHAGVSVVCVWKQAETNQQGRIASDAKGFSTVSGLLAVGAIFNPLSKEGKAEIQARKQGTTTTRQAAPAGVCSVCGNGPLDAQEQAIGQCRACQNNLTLLPAPAPTMCFDCGTSPAPAQRFGQDYCAACVVLVDQRNMQAAGLPQPTTVTPAQPKRRGRVPLVPGAGRPRVTVAQAAVGTVGPAVATVSAPVDTSAETPAARKARILAALKAK
jgi:hypothetical protein